MKKLLSLALVAVMLLSTLMLTSCDPIGSVKGFFNKIMGKDDVQDGIRTTISEIEWRKMYNSTNYTLKVADDEAKMELAFSPTAADVFVDYDFVKYDFIIDFATGALIGKTEFGYMGLVMGDELMIGDAMSLADMGLLPEYKFSDLTYDEQSKSYTAKDKNFLGEFHFENGILVYGVIVPAEGDMDSIIEITNVGTTVVEVPEYINISDGKIEPSKAGKDVVTTVTDEQLKAHLDMKNFTIKADIIIYQIGLKASDASLEMKVGMMGEVMQEKYATIIDGSLYEIAEEYDSNIGEYVFVARPTGDGGDSLFDDLEGIEEYLSTEYLTYNAEGRYYELEVEGTKAYFYFENGQLVQFVVCTDVGLGMPMEVIFRVTDVGTTKVELPEYIIPVPQLDFSLNDDGTGYKITGSRNLTGEVIIPATYNGLPVTEICSYALVSDDITSVVIPDSVVKINSYAFYYCENLTRIDIPGSVKYINSYAFVGCDYLTIYSVHASRPEGWDEEWNVKYNDYTIPVVWEGTAPIDPHTVTREVWDANMTMTNYTATMVMPEGATGAIYQSKDVLLLDMFVESKEVQEYGVCRDGVYYYVYKEDGEWFGRRNGPIDAMPNWTTALDLEFDKSYFYYDYDREAYISLNGSLEIVVYFENDVIVSVDVNSISGENYLSVDFSNIGTTEEIIVPEFTIIE